MLRAVVCIVVIFVCGRAASLHLDANPLVLEDEMSEALAVNCTFSYGNGSTFSGVTSLTLARATNQSRNGSTLVFEDLALVDAFDIKIVSQPSTLNASVTGSISLNGDSFLNVRWEHASTDLLGTYRCTVKGMDATGKPIEKTETIVVAAKEPSIGQVLDQFKQLQAQFHSIVNAFSALRAEVTRTSASDNDLITRLLRLEKFESTFNATLETTRNAMFEVSPEYLDRMYYLSKHAFKDADVAEATCEIYGGYLVEIDDADEYFFVKNFSSSFDIYGVLTGATDEDLEGEWIFRYSKRPMNYTAWYSNEPNTDSNNCQILYSYSRWKMVDNECHHVDRSYNYLCEVPNERTEPLYWL